MNEEKLKRIIEKHVEWVSWRTSAQLGDQKGIPLVLSKDNIADADLSGKNLGSAEFHDTDLKNVSFSGANLKGAVFIECDLTGSKFDGADVAKAVFFHCNLSHVSFQNARCYKCEFDESPMSQVVFKNANLQYAIISELVLSDVDFSGADCYRLFVYSCKFVRCFGEEIKNIDSATLEKTYVEKKDGQFNRVNSLRSICLKGA